MIRVTFPESLVLYCLLYASNIDSSLSLFTILSGRCKNSPTAVSRTWGNQRLWVLTPPVLNNPILPGASTCSLIDPILTLFVRSVRTNPRTYCNWTRVDPILIPDTISGTKEGLAHRLTELGDHTVLQELDPEPWQTSGLIVREGWVELVCPLKKKKKVRAADKDRE